MNYKLTDVLISFEKNIL